MPEADTNILVEGEAERDPWIGQMGAGIDYVKVGFLIKGRVR